MPERRIRPTDPDAARAEDDPVPSMRTLWSRSIGRGGLAGGSAALVWVARRAGGGEGGRGEKAAMRSGDTPPGGLTVTGASTGCDYRCRLM